MAIINIGGHGVSNRAGHHNMQAKKAPIAFNREPQLRVGKVQGPHMDFPHPYSALPQKGLQVRSAGGRGLGNSTYNPQVSNPLRVAGQ